MLIVKPKKIDVITNKKAKDLTKKESEKLRTYQEELTLLKVLKKYPNKNLSRDKRTLIYKSLDTKIENSIPLPVPRLRLYIRCVGLFQCSCTPRLPCSFPI